MAPLLTPLLAGSSGNWVRIFQKFLKQLYTLGDALSTAAGEELHKRTGGVTPSGKGNAGRTGQPAIDSPRDTLRSGR
jgi:hypothetical protein